MKNKIIPLLVSLLFCHYASNGQSNYLAGTSRISIEPDHAVFSVALAGYGLPRDGRFSITWNYVAEAPAIKSITALNEKLYALTSDGEIRIMEGREPLVKWKKAGEAGDIRLLAGMNGRLYAVDQKDELLTALPVKTLHWEKAGTAGGITAMAGLNNKLYAVTKTNELLAGTLTGEKIHWETAGEADSMISLAADGNRIYAVDTGDKLWYTKTYLKNKTWTEIGRFNGFTYTIRIRQIAILNNVWYAVSDDGKLYRSAQKTTHDLTAGALAIRQGNKTVIFVGADVTGFNHSLIKEIKQSIYRLKQIPPENILINAAHDHFAPVTQTWITWGDFYHYPDSIYLNRILKKGIIRAIELALDHLKPAKLYFGRGTTFIGINRRADQNPGAPHDTTLDVLEVRGKDGKNICTLFSTPCHVVFKNDSAESFTLSANFPGVARRVVESRYKASNAIFIQGCAGDINPADTDYTRSGTELGNDVLKVLSGKMMRISGPLSGYLDSIEIFVKPWSIPQIEQFKKANLNIPDVHAEKNVRWANLMLNNYQNGAMPATMPIYVQTLNIGNWKLVGLSREAVNEYAPAIRNIWPGRLVTVAAYCNDVSSYLPRDWHIRLKTYEGDESFYWYGQPAIFPSDILKIVTEQIRTRNR